MKNLSTKVRLSKKYTNHDVRVTGCSVLARCNFSDKQIMSITGHKSIESLMINKKVSANKKFIMGFTLGYALKTGNIPALQENSPLVEVSALPAPEPKLRRLRLLLHRQQSTTKIFMTVLHNKQLHHSCFHSTLQSIS